MEAKLSRILFYQITMQSAISAGAPLKAFAQYYLIFSSG
jgi:hypothetical protein